MQGLSAQVTMYATCTIFLIEISTNILMHYSEYIITLFEHNMATGTITNST